MFKIITTTRHTWFIDQVRRVRALEDQVWAMTQERAERLRELDKAQREVADAVAAAAIWEEEATQATAQIVELRAQGTPRVRGAGGRFVPVTRPETSQEEADRLLAEHQGRMQ